MIGWVQWFVGVVMVFLSISFSSILISPIGCQDLKAAEPDSTPLPTLMVLPEGTSGNSALTFQWGEKKPALAVIKNNDHWWIIFDESATISLPHLNEHPVSGVKSIDILPTKGKGVVLEVAVEPGTTPVVDQVNGLWQISFPYQSSSLPHQASIQLPKSYKDGLTVGLENPGAEVRFINPHTGYTYVVFPSYRNNVGVLEEFIFPEFRIMATVQGVGFQVLKDNITVIATLEQVMIAHPEGLAISLPQDREQVRTKAMPPGLFMDAQDLDWADRREKINEELLDLPHSQHGPGELELAWLLLSDGQASEALGYLTHLAKERPSITNLPLFQILQGMGNLLHHRFSEAEENLMLVREEPEVQIWLCVLNAIQHPHSLPKSLASSTQFHTHLLMAKPMLQNYPQPLRQQLASFVLWAGIATRDVELLASLLDQETRPVSLKVGEVLDLAKARVLMSQNKPDAALQMLGELMEKATSPQIRAIARFDYVVHRWGTLMMKKDDALLELERIRSQCREGWLRHEITMYLEKQAAEKTTTE
jgi:hypothetical protein